MTAADEVRQAWMMLVEALSRVDPQQPWTIVVERIQTLIRAEIRAETQRMGLTRAERPAGSDPTDPSVSTSRQS